MPRGRSNTGFQRTFKVDIVLVFSTLIVCTMVLITSFTYYQNQKASLSLANRIMSDTADRVVATTIEFLRPAQNVAGMAAEVISDGKIDARAGSGLERLFLRALSEYPQLGLIYSADETGNFFQVRREVVDGTLTTRHIDRSNVPPTEKLQYRNVDGKIVRRAESEQVAYDPRVRPWYKDATVSKDLVWTDIYIFNTGRMPGITAAFPAIRPRDGAITAVVGADVTLSQLSTFLDGLAISERGIAFIMDDVGQMIAFPGLVPVFEDGDTVRPLMATEVSNPRVTAAVREFIDTRGHQFEFDFEGEKHLVFVREFPDEFGKNWNTVVLIPVNDFLGPIKRNSLITLILSFVVLIVAVLLGVRFSQSIARPVEQLTHELNKIQDFNLGDPVQVKSYVREIQAMETAINSMKNGLQAFRRYVPADLVRELIASGEEVQPGGKEREATILFTDISHFTPIAEEMTAHEIMVNLSDYFDVLTQSVSETKGTVDKFIGDSVMAFWGAPREDAEHALHCCQAVVRAMEKLDSFNEGRISAGMQPFETRFGVNTGFAIVGNVGSVQRLNYTAIGDAANLASRLEGANRYYRTKAIISHNTYRYVRNDFVCRPIDVVVVKGRSAGVKIYELMGERSEHIPQATIRLAELFKCGFEQYMQRDWVNGLKTFEAIDREFPGDGPTEILAQRCRSLLENPPGDDWSGVWSMNMSRSS